MPGRIAQSERRAAAFGAVVPGAPAHDLLALTAHGVSPVIPVRIGRIGGARPLPRVAVHIVQAPGIGAVGAHRRSDQFTIIEAVVTRHDVRAVVIPCVIGQVSVGDVGHVGVAGKISVQIAIAQGTVRAGSAGPLPLGLSGQGHGLADLFRQPLAKGHRLLPGHAYHRLSSLIQGPAQIPFIEHPAALVLEAAVVCCIEARELLVGDLTGGHPECRVNADGRSGLFVRFAGCVAHDELPGRHIG